jgi:hypothetical protein
MAIESGTGVRAAETEAAGDVVSTRTLLLCGMLAGPIYVLVAGVQVLLRDGFDITRHPVSLLSLGDLGWIQIANFVVVGVLVLAAAVGLRRVLDSGRGSTWGPLLIGLYGVGLIASGIFVADAADGFPPGTPAGDPEVVSWHGILHFVAGGIAFLALIAACIVFSRRFAALGERGWSAFSLVTGVFFFVSFGLVAAFPGQAVTNLLLTAAVVLGWTWFSLLAARTIRTSSDSATGGSLVSQRAFDGR